MTVFKKPVLFVVLLASAILSLFTYNNLQYQSEAVKSAWAQVLVEYQRRADLIPGLASLVKTYATHEKTVLTQVEIGRAHV